MAISTTPSGLENPWLRRLRPHIEGCKAFGQSYYDWRERRKFLIPTIDRDGSFFDIGCGSGFLIACLSIWSDKNLLPFGIDKDAGCISLAKSFYSSKPDHFVCSDFRDFDPANAKWPTRFDYIHWNIPSMSSHITRRIIIQKYINYLSNHGKFILSLYSSDFDEGIKDSNCCDMSKMTKQWFDLSEQIGFDLSEIIWGRAQALQSAAVIEASQVRSWVMSR